MLPNILDVTLSSFTSSPLSPLVPRAASLVNRLAMEDAQEKMDGRDWAGRRQRSIHSEFANL